MTSPRPIIVGIGLNKTATKSVRVQLQRWDFDHCFDYAEAYQLCKAGNTAAVLEIMEGYDSFEDWPWPLMYQEIDRHFPNAKFVLTTRSSAEVWYRSLCKMAVRIGPLREYEKFIYGSSMPHGRKKHHVEFYEQHNAAVRAYFADRPGKLLELCVAQESSSDRLAAFVGREPDGKALPKVNVSDSVYAGDNLAIAHLARLRYQWPRKVKAKLDRSRD